MTTARTPYEAGTPDTPTFPPYGPSLGVSSSSFAEAEAALGRSKSGIIIWVRDIWHRFVEQAKDIACENTGMLLVAASEVCASHYSEIIRLAHMKCQAFYATMNLAVKELSGIDLPVGTMQLIWIRMVRLAQNVRL